ncbi:DUF808 domain-containing protein [Nocardioides sp. TRM66260-LWL]|uniref:DUF808 domain-containing protein n=1 Tax=Nocardioides sp. TRM66260-LWL TaxID=2874478 RepID=UPI001CC45EAC|nr:DUF808 domain-containing protein [Nocardioides sp. TRM66260-LWL]MBZ5734206.1 DUF808 domain-containing protein [Nocardioides sp. TRM66260-LWL]
MSGGLFALLDDVAALARLAAASVDDVGAAAGRASVKAAGVVVDDTAVTPQYVQGVAAERELPIIKRIAIGSLRNKLLIILPVAMLLSQVLPGALTPILMAGGTFLCFEGAEKIWERLSGHGGHGGDGGHDASGSAGEAGDAGHAASEPAEPADAAAVERRLVAGAVRTDLILSAEIMVIALDEVAEEPFLSRLLILVVVALAITALVYGVVAAIVKMDDVGVALARRGGAVASRVGHALVRAMPGLLATISTVGVVAMLWVGGHILLVGVDDLGWHPPYEAVHHLEESVHEAVHGPLGSVLAWLTATACSAAVGVVVGAVVVLVRHLLPRRRAAR